MYHDRTPADQGMTPKTEETRHLSRAERRRQVREAQRTSRSGLQRIVTDGLLGLAIDAGLEVLQNLCEAEADALCGAPKCCGAHCLTAK